MNGVRRIGGSIVAGVLVFAIAAVTVTAVLDSFVWPSALIGLPAGVTLGLAAAVATYFELAAREQRRASVRQTSQGWQRRQSTAMGFVATVVGALVALVVFFAVDREAALVVLTAGLPLVWIAVTVGGYLTMRQPGGKGRTRETARR